ncbi:MAG: hypothetical protein NC429_07300 [Lachnospiraceae bacterium]|nr:hypothetical protein [Lachnospiraceae bacterium]
MSENTGGNGGRLTEEQLAVLEKAKRPIDIANRFRIFFLFASIVLVAVVYLGDKFGGGGYSKISAWMYLLLWLDIVLMLVSIFVKIGFAVRYNHILKKL